ncbi:kinase-like domain-containing protein, partial [Favolaschia claudopus]
MVHCLDQALPLRFMSSVFACLLRKFGLQNYECLNQFQSWINVLKTWDTKTCLVNFRSVLATTFEFSRSTESHILPMSLINVVIHTDIRCVCAQLANILRDKIAYNDFLASQDDTAQKLLDLLQDVRRSESFSNCHAEIKIRQLLDYPLLDIRVGPIILKALLKLSSKSGRHPRCFSLADRLQLSDFPAAAGSYGDVWKGSLHGATVSVKVMRVYQEADVEALLKEFHREALIWRQLSHPNLLPFFGAYYLQSSKRQLCLVSPWMDNGDVSRYLKTHPEQVNRLSLVLDVALGLDHLHGRKLVHGDLKAINVLVTRSGRAVLADFGLSSVTDSKILLSTSTKAAGTMRWQAPELFQGSPNSFASDMYAFSCVCYEIFTGNLPFHRLTPDIAVMYKVMQGERPERSSTISDEVWSLMEECWSQCPEDRLSAEQVVFRLRNRPIGAVPTKSAMDWDPWFTSKFRASLEDHTLFLSCGTIE